MKILLLSDPNSTHTKKWVTALAQNNIEIAIFGLGIYEYDLYGEFPDVTIFSGGNGIKSSLLGKLSYLNTFSVLKKAYADFKPDLVHAHYATSYGMLGGLLKHSPYIISVWGSDVYDFPNRSFFHKQVLKRNLSKVNVVLSTGSNMALETKKYTDKPIEITPFGVDTKLFAPLNKDNEAKVIIGTVKALEEVYGIDYLIRAFKLVVENNPDKDLELIIAGDGSLENELKLLVSELGIDEMVSFIGRVDHNKVPEVLNQFDIYAALSNSESFGVAILEASSCEIPVVVSDADGFKEVVKNGETGLIVPRRNPKEAADAIQKLINNNRFRKGLGVAGRKHVLEHYDWDNNVAEILKIYKDLLSSTPFV
mgnify:CR=1 FL=1